MIKIYIVLLVLIKAAKLENETFYNTTYNNQNYVNGVYDEYINETERTSLSQQITTKSVWWKPWNNNAVTTTQTTVLSNQNEKILASPLPYTAITMERKPSIIKPASDNNSDHQNQESNDLQNDSFFKKTCSLTPKNDLTEQRARIVFSILFTNIKYNFENLTKYDKHSKSKLVSKNLNSFLNLTNSNDCEITWDYMLQLKHIIDLLYKTGDINLLDKEVIKTSFQRQLSNFAIGLQKILELQDGIAYDGIDGLWHMDLKRKIKKRVIELKLRIANSFQEDVKYLKDDSIIWKYEHELSRIMNKTILSVSFFIDNNDIITTIKELRKYLDTFD